ncbi:MAG: ribonuclease H-like domain-containing protein [Lachnospiraceae bacterium]|nr:ribonuclease H-like domain-containing protein [Lachnospiraceae bacterium]
MKTISSVFDIVPSYPLEELLSEGQTKEDILFVDIETTGLTARNSSLYLAGCIFFKEEKWQYIQWLAETYDEELQVLTAFFEFLHGYRFLIHYNGNRFDLPYLEQKAQQYSMPYSFADIDGVDIYRRILPYRDILGLPDLKQRTVEEFLGLEREDPYTGGQLISRYHDYVCEKDPQYEAELLKHNADDLYGMLQVVGMLSYPDIFLKPVRVMKVHANYFNDVNKKRSQEIILKLRFGSPLPKPVSFRALGCYFSAEGIDGSLKVPLYEEELKFFYANYRDYYYLPAEDMAMHKAIAGFVDKEHRVQATAANCYTRKKSLYLPQWDVLFTPFFKREYRSRDLFFELTDEFKKSRSGFNMYAEHILSSMFQYRDE